MNKTIHLAKEAGVDSYYKWIVICERHNNFVGVPTKSMARQVHTNEFCEECRSGI